MGAWRCRTTYSAERRSGLREGRLLSGAAGRPLCQRSEISRCPHPLVRRAQIRRLTKQSRSQIKVQIRSISSGHCPNLLLKVQYKFRSIPAFSRPARLTAPRTPSAEGNAMTTGPNLRRTEIRTSLKVPLQLCTFYHLTYQLASTADPSPHHPP